MHLNMVHHQLPCPSASTFSWKNLSKAARDGLVRVSSQRAKCVPDVLQTRSQDTVWHYSVFIDPHWG